MMMRMVSRKANVSGVHDTSVALPEFWTLTQPLEKLFQHDRVDDTAETRAGHDEPDGLGATFEEPVSCDSSCWRVDDATRQAERHVRKEDLVVLGRECQAEKCDRGQGGAAND